MPHGGTGSLAAVIEPDPETRQTVCGFHRRAGALTARNDHG